ncbi:hypothetical protein Ga0061061_103333 [Chelatococcus sambhunathii]|uniref:Thymidylate kinase n=1 Tax=Chelatococcus sambhunathii TaxID=363953 RepID=A0ABP2A242_9HYPH|nr:hypothetical protein [Chelatococcus sambhunathii]CUA87446.1 hypothetical protein Ga0061061_103333 [Chelatococcus sambhunathii]
MVQPHRAERRLRALRPMPPHAPRPDLVLDLLARFGQQQICYCYWKGTEKLAGALGGEGDLDLLVSRADHGRAQAILLSAGFKFFPSVKDREPVGVFTYLGFDEGHGRLVHVHLHTRLVSGGPLTRHWHLPWEEAVLARAVSHEHLPVRHLDPASEALLLLTRCCLECGGWDPVSLRRGRAQRAAFATARQGLRGKVSREDLYALAAALLPDDLAVAFSDALNGPLPDRHSPLGRAIRHHLADGARAYNGTESALRSAGRSMSWLLGRFNRDVVQLPRPWNRRPAAGGLVVALVGVDGSGKSTLLSALTQWLSPKFDVLPIYFGTGDGRPSLVLRPLKWLLPLATRAAGSKPRVASHGKPSAAAPSFAYGLLLTVWALAVAADKRAKLAAAWRGANRGLLVLTDRYPQCESRRFNDGPLLERLPAVPGWLRRHERAVYERARRLPPHLVLKLLAAPESLALREPAMDPTVIRQRLDALSGLAFGGADIVCLDADRPLEEVILRAKREIWQRL